MNYGAGNLTNKGPDGGIDGIIDEDELGLSKIYIQAKDTKTVVISIGQRFSSLSAPSQIKIPKKVSLSLQQNLLKKLKISPKIIKILAWF